MTFGGLWGGQLDQYKDNKWSKDNKEPKGNDITNKSYLFYGNHISNLHPKYLGRTRALFYHNDYPLIIIGPDCKY